MLFSCFTGVVLADGSVQYDIKKLGTVVVSIRFV